MVDLTSTITNLAMKAGLGLLIVVILAVLYFGSKSIMKYYKRRKNYKITTNIYNRDGTFYQDRIGKFKDVDGIDKMLFLGSGESMPVIDTVYIVNNQVTLWRYAPNQYAVVPPRMWAKDPKDFKIDIINFQMKNFAYLEQRAAVSRWAYMKDMLQKWAPYITVLLILVICGVAVYFITKMAISEYNAAVAQRIAECSRLIGGGSAIAPPS